MFYLNCTLQRSTTSQGPAIHVKEGAPLPGSQEAANQLTQQIKQQLALQAQQNQGHPGSHGGPAQAPHGLPAWQVPHMRSEGPRQPGPQGPITGEARTSMPGPVPIIGGNPQQVQRVSPNPPTKSPTVAQTAPNMVLGFSQHQTAAPRAPSPAVAKVNCNLCCCFDKTLRGISELVAYICQKISETHVLLLKFYHCVP